MTRPAKFSPLVGRPTELRELYSKICAEKNSTLLITGPSGIGKTALSDHFSTSIDGGRERFSRVWFQSLYRASWTSALADFRRRFELAPQNATIEEIEESLIKSCQSFPTLIVLDNADDGNVVDLNRFLHAWQKNIHDSSTLIITAQPHIAAQLPQSIPTMALEGVRSNAALLDIMGDLGQKFSERLLLEVASLVEGNPQKLLFLNWVQPMQPEELKEKAANLQRGEDEFAVEDFMDSANIPSLFFLALGIHRSFVVTDKLLASLWDQLGSRGAAAYVRVRDSLLKKKILLPVEDKVFYLHESVHVQLEKGLLHRVGGGRILDFHHYFAEFYERALGEEVATKNLTHFIHHSLAAKDYALAFRPVVDGAAAQALKTQGAAVLVRQELEKLDTPECLQHVTPLDEVRLYLTLGGLCNDLSDHAATLRYMTRAKAVVNAMSQHEANLLQRQIWYYSAVSFSNLGQSDKCMQEYFKIVDSSADPEDELACLSLGYLAHDLKYRDLMLALELGELSVNWAEEYSLGQILPKNMCSYAESLAIANQLPVALKLFADAAERAEKQNNIRELGRIETNWGFALALQGHHEGAISHLDLGRKHSGSMGDRRRQTQAVLHGGVARWLKGDRAEGQRLINQAADLLRVLGDGRYFMPAFCWTLQLAGHMPGIYPTFDDPSTVEAARRAGNEELLAYAASHPEFAVYHQFWWRHLSSVLKK